MSALSSNKDVQKSVGDVVSFLGASGVHIYAGAMVQGTSAGYAGPASGASASRFFGVAWDEMDNTSSNKKLGTVSNGSLSCRAYVKGVFTIAAQGTPAITHLGRKVYVIDDQTVGLSAGAWCYAGRVVDFTSSTYRVMIDSAFGVLGQDAGVSTGIAHDVIVA